MSIEPPVVRPATLTEAFELMAGGSYRPLAGGTDLMVQLEADVVELPAAVLDLWRLGELRGVGYDGYDVAIGALTTWTELRHSPVIRARLPALSEAAATIGAAQIQNRGTIGGNICNASPAGDSLPVLLAVDATFDVGSTAGQRSIPAREFWTGYRQTALRRDELLLHVRFPVERGRRTRFRKVGGRAAQAISKVVMALSYRDDGPTWTEVRLALGSVAPTPMRAGRTEAVLEGASPREAVADEAAAVLAEEITPIDDVRSTAAYRRSVSGRVLHRLLREEGGW
ncbi:MAG TPA: xanthine dehydrogenase family protein subunit M [Candidatus Deferrimicrobium sp.]|nr:xanthine dehydrogenase family protein subunit M [Candidatus Deferrimicrobium sp.]